MSAASLPLAVGAACYQCGASGVGPADSGLADARDVATPQDAGQDADAGSWWDGAAMSDWPGWRRLTGLDPSCPTDIPLDPWSAMPALVWIPCTSGRTQCNELDLSKIPHPALGTIFVGGRVGLGAQYLVVFRLTDQKDVAEQDVYSVAGLVPAAAWRYSEGNPACLVGPIPTKDKLVMYAEFAGVSNIIPATAIGTPAALMTSMTNATFVHWSPDPQSRPQFIAASETAFAGDLGVMGAILRQPPATSSYVKTTPQGLSRPLVFGDDVLAWNEHGNNYWAEEVVVKPDASTYILRAVANKNIVGFATDGVSLWWQETSGTANADQTTNLTIDVFQAPYTTDPTTLASTAKKVTTFTNATLSSIPITFNGLYAWPGGFTTYIVRGDGTFTTVASDGKTWSQFPVYVSSSEYWSIESTLPSGPLGTAFTRIQLGTW